MKLALFFFATLWLNPVSAQDLAFVNFEQLDYVVEKRKQEQSEDVKNNTPDLAKINSMLIEFVDKKFVYPDLALENQFEGEIRILVKFDEFGNLQNYAINQRIGFGIDKAIDEIMKQVPVFYPAASLNLIIPVKFSIK